MEIKTDIYGYDPKSLLQSVDEVYRRLRAILSDKVLGFNPYRVDDETLLACVERAIWRPWPALTQMVVFHIHDIRRVKWSYPFDAIFFHVGNDKQELHLPVSTLIKRITYTATLRQIHMEVDGYELTNEKIVERMVGKDYFVSYSLPARMEGGRGISAYRMYRLKGSNEQKAEIIRRRMIEAKVTMLKEILKYPYASHYLQCSRNFVDYTTPILEAISAIQRFPE